MTALLDALARRTRLVATLVLLTTTLGIVASLIMDRQEDPAFADRFGTVVVPWPGADAERVDALVVARLQEELAEVPEIAEVRSTARAGVAVLVVELDEQVTATAAAWDDVEQALQRASRLLPAEAGPVDLDDRVVDPASVVVMVTGSDDPLVLRDAARVVQQQLRELDGVQRVDRIGDPGARLAVRVDPALGARLDLDPATLAAQLSSRNVTLPGGELAADGRRVVLDPQGDLVDLAELRSSPIRLPDGSAVPLSELAHVDLEPLDPVPSLVLHEGRRAVALQVVPELPRDLVGFGDDVRVALSRARLAIAPLRVEVFAFQPDEVRSRLTELGTSLLMGVLIVAGVLMAAMGVRLGGVVSAVVPLVALATVGLYALGGGVLHQISIAALVLALGLLVDNAIVVAEAVQQHLDEGKTGPQAARAAVQELALPLGTSTGTTVAAFVPMLLASGATAEFTRAIPVVAITALVLSYVFAVVVTPMLSARFLRAGAGSHDSRLSELAIMLGRRSSRAPWQTLAGLGAALALAGALATGVPGQFFPLSDRARFVVSVELPEGTSIDRTEELVRELADALAAEEGVTSTSAFVGRGPPRFYYNLNDTPAAPHAATVVVSTDTRERVPEVIAKVSRLARAMPEARVVARPLQQGPPVGAPVEVLLVSEDPQALARAADQVVVALRGVRGARDVAHDLGLGAPTLALTMDDGAAVRRGLGRRDLSLALLGRTRGMDAGTWRGSWEPVPVQVTSPRGDGTSPGELPALDVEGPAGSAPLAQVATITPRWVPSVVRRVDGARTVVVSAQLDGAEASQVVAAARPVVEAATPEDVRVRWAGEAEGSGEANAALLGAVPVGAAMLLFFLLLQFDSLRRVGIILVTVPLAAVGVVPGLALSGQPFGFMSMLGVIALVGVVVNNAIVLLEVVEVRRSAGDDVDSALTEAVRVRLRPILLTTTTTVAGLLPLAGSGSSLWPPLAWAMISGLVASTALTLLAVPALYKLLLDGPPRPPRWPLLAVLGLAQGAGAQPITWDQALAEAETAPLVEAARQDALAAHASRTGAWLAAVGPSVGGRASTLWRDDSVDLDTPFGPIVQQPARQAEAGAELVVPLLRPGSLARATAVAAAARARDLDAERTAQLARRDAGHAWLDVADADARLAAARAHEGALVEVAGRARQRAEAGLDVAADTLRAEVALADVRQQIRALEAQRTAATLGLAARVGRTGSVDVYGDPSPLPEATSGSRPDLDAAEERVRAARRGQLAQGAGGLPDLELFGGWRWSDNEALVDPSWLEGGARITWTPVAGGQRVAAARAAGADTASARARAEALALQVQVEQGAARAALDVARTEIEVRRRSVERARSSAEQLGERYQAGLASLTDLLQVQADLRAQDSALRLAELGAQRAALELAFVSGSL